MIDVLDPLGSETTYAMSTAEDYTNIRYRQIITHEN